jgi:hypothetical protein
MDRTCKVWRQKEKEMDREKKKVKEKWMDLMEVGKKEIWLGTDPNEKE